MSFWQIKFKEPQCLLVPSGIITQNITLHTFSALNRMNPMVFSVTDKTIKIDNIEYLLDI